MKTRAPGKVVLSGAYSVLHGAPAIVTAVDRYVLADSTQTGDRLTNEVRAAGLAHPYWFDATQLRAEGRKLGLGSSAAILLATLAARELEQNPRLGRMGLQERLFLPALTAHRLAQGGGSGIDVAACCFGGTLEYRTTRELPVRSPITLPRALTLEVWSSTVESTTSGLLARVNAFRDRAPSHFGKILTEQSDAAAWAVRACREDSAVDFITSLHAQREALIRLGEGAEVDIVTADVRALAEVAARQGAAVLPAGAGGGDIALYVGFGPSTALDSSLAERRHCRLDLRFGAEGVHRVESEC